MASTILSSARRAGVGQGDLAVTQSAQQVLADVGQLLQPAEGEEAARALDGVDRPEDAGQQLAGAGVLLQGEQVAVELVEVLVALHEELGHDLVDRFHADSSSPGRTRYVIGVSRWYLRASTPPRGWRQRA